MVCLVCLHLFIVVGVEVRVVCCYWLACLGFCVLEQAGCLLVCGFV